MTVYSDRELERFREVQQLAYQCTEAIEAELREGQTEKEVARMMRRWLGDHGIVEYFHVPFVWFGDRTSFTGFRTPLKFRPSGRRLEPGMPVILDVAPASDGYSCDIGYSCCLGENPTLEKMQDDLEEYRGVIAQMVKQGRTAKEVYAEVDRIIERQGYANRHQAYPLRVLAHKVFRMEPSWLRRVELAGFGVRALRGLGRSTRAARFGRAQAWPYWNDHKASDVRIDPGLWAVEPHLGLGPIGAKWEELLVVTEDDAYWLDDDLPHVRRWSRKKVDAA
ncbi:MAG: M24 family metallopeptidase [Myxococcales bacterium]|nr:M24 family metallopeptidase [Myxococcales bacterium]